MRVKVVSDGTRSGTKIVHADTGEVLENVIFAEWTTEAFDGSTRLELTIAEPTVEIEADATITSRGVDHA